MTLAIYLILNASVLAFAASQSGGGGWRLAWKLFLLLFVVGLANNLLEAVVFKVISITQALAAAATALPAFALLSLVAVTIARRWRRDGGDAPKPIFTPLRLVLAVAAYELLYFAAGMLVYPYVADYYEPRGLPPIGLVAGLQVVRALIFVGAAYPLLRAGLRKSPLVLALAYSILGGLAPLVLPNPYMPSDIRFYHAIEVGVSNFLFGLVIGFLLTIWNGTARRSGGRS